MALGTIALAAMKLDNSQDFDSLEAASLITLVTGME